MAGGYDGTQEYYETDLNSTLRLINDESFVYAGVVSINVVKFQSICKLSYFIFLQLPFTSKSHCMVGINETFYLLAGGERGDYSK